MPPTSPPARGALFGNVSLYVLIVLIWGSSFYGIKHQLTTVAPQVSIFYRFALAAALLFAYCLWRKKPMGFAAALHARFAVLGLFLFNLNFTLIYFGAVHLTTGLVAVVFSLVILFNIANGRLFLGERITARMSGGAALGILGITLVFYPEVRAFDGGRGALIGLAFTLGGTLSASFGMITSATLQRRGLPVLQTNAWGMLYGALIMLVIVTAGGLPFAFDATPGYMLSLAYLAVFASVLGFGCFLTLVGNIGTARASYASVLFPILALTISTWLEGYQWSVAALCGVALALAGNAIILSGRRG